MNKILIAASILAFAAGTPALSAESLSPSGGSAHAPRSTWYCMWEYTGSGAEWRCTWVDPNPTIPT